MELNPPSLHSPTLHSQTFKTKDTVKVFFFTWDSGNPKTASFLDLIGSKFQPTSEIEEADICIAHGTDCIMGGEALGSLRSSCNFTKATPYLEKLLARSVPMYSANPDLKAVSSNGVIEYMPGVIAAKYEELGGSVTWYGKPGKEHFEECVKLIGLPKEKIVHVGDSLHHDVKGANNSGVDCIWVVKTGIHNEEVEAKVRTADEGKIKFLDSPSHTNLPLVQGIEKVLEDEGGFKPTWIVDGFRME